MSAYTVHVDHAEGTREEWARRWERFFNLGDGEALVPDDAERVPLSVAVLDAEAYAGRSIVIVEQVFSLPQELDAPVRDPLRGALRAKYWSGAKSAIPSHRGSAGGLTAAFHLRRGDVEQTRNANHYVGDAAALRQIARLRQALAPFGWPLTLNLYSEGAAADFGAFTDADCRLHISEDPFETLHNMSTADILIGGYSNFSYLAALLSRGIVLYHRRSAPRFSNCCAGVRTVLSPSSICGARREVGWVGRNGSFMVSDTGGA